MGDGEQRRLIRDLAATAAETVEHLRRERDRRRAAGQETATVEALLRDLEPIANEARDLSVVDAIRGVVERHGGGPYPVDDLAALVDVDVEVAQVRRVLDQMVRARLAHRE